MARPKVCQECREYDAMPGRIICAICLDPSDWIDPGPWFPRDEEFSNNLPPDWSDPRE